MILTQWLWTYWYIFVFTNALIDIIESYSHTHSLNSWQLFIHTHRLSFHTQALIEFIILIFILAYASMKIIMHILILASTTTGTIHVRPYTKAVTEIAMYTSINKLANLEYNVFLSLSVTEFKSRNTRLLSKRTLIINAAKTHYSCIPGFVTVTTSRQFQAYVFLLQSCLTFARIFLVGWYLRHS